MKRLGLLGLTALACALLCAYGADWFATWDLDRCHGPPTPEIRRCVSQSALVLLSLNVASKALFVIGVGLLALKLARSSFAAARAKQAHEL